MAVRENTESRVFELHEELHSISRWYGDDGDDTMSTANNTTGWQLTAGAINVFGTELQIAGANDVLDADFGITVAKFTVHQVLITHSSVFDANYILQFYCGTSTFGAATLCAEVSYHASSTLTEATPTDVHMDQTDVGSKLWTRIRCESATKTMDFLVGLLAQEAFDRNLRNDFTRFRGR